MPAIPASILEPLWDQFAALLPTRHPSHPLGCHRPRIPARVIFDKLVQVLVFGCATAASTTRPARPAHFAAVATSGSLTRSCNDWNTSS